MHGNDRDHDQRQAGRQGDKNLAAPPFFAGGGGAPWCGRGVGRDRRSGPGSCRTGARGCGRACTWGAVLGPSVSIPVPLLSGVVRIREPSRCWCAFARPLSSAVKLPTTVLAVPFGRAGSCPRADAGDEPSSRPRAPLGHRAEAGWVAALVYVDRGVPGAHQERAQRDRARCRSWPGSRSRCRTGRCSTASWWPVEAAKGAPEPASVSRGSGATWGHSSPRHGARRS